MSPPAACSLLIARRSPSRRLGAAALLLAASFDVRAQVEQATASTPENTATQLPAVTVEGQRNAFTKSDRRLKGLIDSLPCSGCDTKKIELHKSLTERALTAVADQVLPAAAPDDSIDRANSFDRRGHTEPRGTGLMGSLNSNP